MRYASTKVPLRELWKEVFENSFRNKTTHVARVAFCLADTGVEREPRVWGQPAALVRITKVERARASVFKRGPKTCWRRENCTGKNVRESQLGHYCWDCVVTSKPPSPLPVQYCNSRGAPQHLVVKSESIAVFAYTFHLHYYTLDI